MQMTFIINRQEVRAQISGNRHYWMLKDVADALGYHTHCRKEIFHIEAGKEKMMPFRTKWSIQQQLAVVISERDLIAWLKKHNTRQAKNFLAKLREISSHKK